MVDKDKEPSKKLNMDGDEYEVLNIKDIIKSPIMKSINFDFKKALGQSYNNINENKGSISLLKDRTVSPIPRGIIKKEVVEGSETTNSTSQILKNEI